MITIASATAPRTTATAAAVARIELAAEETMTAATLAAIALRHHGGAAAVADLLDSAGTDLLDTGTLLTVISRLEALRNLASAHAGMVATQLGRALDLWHNANVAHTAALDALIADLGAEVEVREYRMHADDRASELARLAAGA